jgi:hypothetical protein|tara:strand:+ start:89287 stop:89583 length:297 start_codon:yes stop_codon:yes gene_type:complete
LQTKTPTDKYAADPSTVLAMLEKVANNVDVDIRYEVLADEDVNITSGLCYLHGRRYLIIDQKLCVADKIKVLVNHLKRFDLDNIYLLPVSRDLLDGEE